MKNLVPFLCCVALLGCDPQKTTQQANKVYLVDTTGEPKISEYFWQVIAEPGKAITFRKLLDDHGGYSGSGNMIPPHPGWLVAIPTKSDLWYFDGKDRGMLIHYAREGSTSYGLAGAQAHATPPKEFLDRLPPQVRASIAAK